MKSPVVYIGLFLIAFALYANELKKAPKVKPQATTLVTQARTNEPPVPGSKLQGFAAKLSEVLSSRKELPDGIRIQRGVNDFSGLAEVQLQWGGDDVYAVGDFAIRETWYSLIERVGKLIQSELDNGLHLEIRGFADENSDLERKSGDYGKSSYAFSFARAEWLGHFLEQSVKRPEDLKKKKLFTLMGMGGVEHGRKIVMAFSYGI